MPARSLTQAREQTAIPEWKQLKAPAVASEVKLLRCPSLSKAQEEADNRGKKPEPQNVLQRLANRSRFKDTGHR